MADTTTQITRPAPFIETLGKTFGEGVARLGAKPFTAQEMAGMAPSVAPQIGGATGTGMGQQAQQAAATQAGLGALTFDATTGAVTGAGQGTGVAGYQPYLGQAVTHAGGAAGAFSSQVRQDPGGGGTWHQQTRAKERQGQQVAGPGFGSGAYFNQGGRVGYKTGGRVGILAAF